MEDHILSAGKSEPNKNDSCIILFVCSFLANNQIFVVPDLNIVVMLLTITPHDVNKINTVFYLLCIHATSQFRAG